MLWSGDASVTASTSAKSSKTSSRKNRNRKRQNKKKQRPRKKRFLKSLKNRKNSRRKRLLNRSTRLLNDLLQKRPFPHQPPKNFSIRPQNLLQNQRTRTCLKSLQGLLILWR